MNKRIIILIVIVLIIQYFTPWWIIFPIAFINGWYSLNKRTAILSSLGGICSAWSLLFLYKYLTGGAILISRVAIMLKLGNSIYLFGITISLAAIGAFLGSICGFYLWKLKNNI